MKKVPKHTHTQSPKKQTQCAVTLWHLYSTFFPFLPCCTSVWNWCVPVYSVHLYKCEFHVWPGSVCSANVRSQFDVGNIFNRKHLNIYSLQRDYIPINTEWKNREQTWAFTPTQFLCGTTQTNRPLTKTDCLNEYQSYCELIDKIHGICYVRQTW